MDGTEADDNDGQLALLHGMERLLDAVTDLASARSLDEIAEIVRHAARELTGADGATFVLRDAGSCFYMQEDAIEPLWRGLRFPMEACISGWAMLNRQGVAIADIYEDERIPHDAYRPTFVKSLTMSPIRTADPIGAIGNYWADTHHASASERRLLQALADSTAVALESVRTFTELEDRVAERTAQLARANRDLDQFASMAAHDLRTPIGNIAGFAAVLEDQVGEQAGIVGQAVEAITRGSERALTLIEELLAFARAGSTQVEATPVDLDDLVAQVLAELDPIVTSADAKVAVAPLGTIDGDAGLLRHALQNLLHNALTHVRDGVPPSIQVGATRPDGQLRLSVTDNGPGVAPEDQERILEPFVRGTTPSRHVGSGLGLAICGRVAEHHGGTLRIAVAPGGGSTFELVLPLRA